MRNFPYILVGEILDEINTELAEDYGRKGKITRPTFYRLEKSLKFPEGERTPGGWRSYKLWEKEEIKQKIRKAYSLPEKGDKKGTRTVYASSIRRKK